MLHPSPCNLPPSNLPILPSLVPSLHTGLSWCSRWRGSFWAFPPPPSLLPSSLPPTCSLSSRATSTGRGWNCCRTNYSEYTWTDKLTHAHTRADREKKSVPISEALTPILDIGPIPGGKNRDLIREFPKYENLMPSATSNVSKVEAKQLDFLPFFPHIEECEIFQTEKDLLYFSHVSQGPQNEWLGSVFCIELSLKV